MAIGENTRKRKSVFLSYVCYTLLLLLLAVCSILLWPVYRDYTSQKKELGRLRAELEKLKEERNAKRRKANALESSPAAVEKVAREKYRLVKDGEAVLIFEDGKKK